MDSKLDDAARPRTATIIDVANEAGVAVGTVSRYLNGQPIRQSNRDQIENAVLKLGYRRNALAAAMKSQLTNTVGFLVPQLTEFHAPVLEHLSRLLRKQGGRSSPIATTTIPLRSSTCSISSTRIASMGW